MKRLLTVLSLLVSLNVYAQPNSDSAVTKARVDKYYINSYFKDYRDIFRSPFHPSVKKYVGAGIYAGTMYLLISHGDEQVQLFSQRQRMPFTNNLTKYVFEPVGSGVYPLIAVATFYATGVIWQNQRSKKVAMNCVKSFLIANSFVQVRSTLFHVSGHLQSRLMQINGSWEITTILFFQDIQQLHFQLQQLLQKNIRRLCGFP